MGPRAAKKPSGAPMKMNNTHAMRRARARFGRCRLGPLGSFQSGRGRLRELAIRTPNTRMGINKVDDESIRNDKRAMPGRTALRTEIPRLTPKPVFSGRRGEKTKSFAVISSHSNEGMMRFPRGQRVGGLASHTLERVLGIVHRDHRRPHRSRAPPVVWGSCRAIRSESPAGRASELPR